MSVTIPLTTEVSNFRQTVDLDNATFSFQFRWNLRMEAWMMSLYDSSDILLIAGRRMVINYDLLNSRNDKRLPGGSLIALDTSRLGTEMKYADLGTRVQLIYIPVEG